MRRAQWRQQRRRRLLTMLMLLLLHNSSSHSSHSRQKTPGAATPDAAAVGAAGTSAAGKAVARGLQPGALGPQPRLGSLAGRGSRRGRQPETAAMRSRPPPPTKPHRLGRQSQDIQRRLRPQEVRPARQAMRGPARRAPTGAATRPSPDCNIRPLPLQATTANARVGPRPATSGTRSACSGYANAWPDNALVRTSRGQ